MRIWILNHYASPPDRPAGTRHYDFGRLLAGWGHEVTIFASSFSHFSRAEERLTGGERMRVQDVDGVRFVWIRTTPYSRNDYRRVLNMVSYAAGVIRAQHRLARPDVVVGSCVHPLAVIAAWLIGVLRRAPFVFEVRDLWPQTLIDVGALRPDGAAARVLRAAERFLYHRARLVISLLPGAAEYITGSGVPQSKIIYIPNGIAASPMPAAQPDAATSELADRIKRFGEGRRLVAGYVGSHGLANGVELLVQAAGVLHGRAISDIALVLVGDGPGKQQCERLAGRLGLRNVLFAPPVPKHAVPGVLESVDVTLFPLRDAPVFRYGLSSNKLFDYLASGRPVIAACAVPDNPVQQSGGGICVPPGEPDAVADALVRLAEAGAAGRRAIGDRGRRWVYQHHDVTVLAQRYLQALADASR
jgi:glycosyltransferase involved in cell wall biosynthesis